MAHKPIELLYPKAPKAEQLKASLEKRNATKRSTRAPKIEVVTPETIAKQLEEWALNTEATDLKEFTVPRRMLVKKLKALAQEHEVMMDAFELAREAIAKNINQKWQDKPYIKDYATMYVEFYDDELHRHKNNIRAAVTAKTTQGPTTINITDSSGYKQN